MARRRRHRRRRRSLMWAWRIADGGGASGCQTLPGGKNEPSRNHRSLWFVEWTWRLESLEELVEERTKWAGWSESEGLGYKGLDFIFFSFIINCYHIFIFIKISSFLIFQSKYLSSRLKLNNNYYISFIILFWNFLTLIYHIFLSFALTIVIIPNTLVFLKER